MDDESKDKLAGEKGGGGGDVKVASKKKEWGKEKDTYSILELLIDLSDGGQHVIKLG